MRQLSFSGYRRLTSLLYYLAYPVIRAIAVLIPKYGFRYNCMLARYPARMTRGWAVQEKRIWLHAVSVGESVVAISLIRAIARDEPDVSFILSTTTATAQAEARKRLPPRTSLIHAPLDFPRSVARALDQIRPCAMVLLETELWPNWIAAAHERDIPCVLLNGRISTRSFERYLSVQRLTRHVLEQLALVSAASADDAERFRRLGAPDERVEVNGNAKFDQLLELKGSAELDRIEQVYRLRDEPMVIVAGSTRTGEEAPIVEAWEHVRSRHPNTVLVIAPRHPQRSGRVEELLKRGNLSFDRRSQLSPDQPRSAPIVLVDTIGELFALYAFATVTFVGATLVPKGGHNVLEPAIWAKPVVFGPHVEDFADAAAWLKEAGACVQVEDAEGLRSAFADLLNDPEKARETGAHGEALLRSADKSAVRHVRALQKVLCWKSGADPS